MSMIINRSPEGAEGNGGEQGAEGQKAPEYVDRTTFDSRFSQLEQTIRGLAPQERKENVSRETKRDEAPREPKWEDFKDRPNGVREFNKANYQFDRWEEKQQEAVANTEKESKASEERTKQGHSKRWMEYVKENPDAVKRYQAASGELSRIPNTIANAVMSSRNSQVALDYLISNTEEINALILLGQTEGIESVRDQVGEWVGLMKSRSEQSDLIRKQAEHRPIRMNLKGGPGVGARKNLSNSERIARYNER